MKLSCAKRAADNQPKFPQGGGHIMATASTGLSKDEKFVIFASSTGTVFEWYDFYLYATLAPFFAALFFPPGNATWHCSAR
jgi:hypothetical protein